MEEPLRALRDATFVMNSHAGHFDPVLKKRIQVQEMQSFRMDSFYVYWLRGKMPNFQYDNLEKKSFTK